LEEMKIRSEQQKLEAEHKQLERVLGSEARLKTLIKKELQADAEQFGDVRRSMIVERPAAEAVDEAAFIPSEPLTVVLSHKGWVRAGKGHELDPRELHYKAGDHFQQAVRLRSQQTALFLDSTGRSYALPAHTLPSARGQGEPLSGRFSLPEGAQVVATLGGDPEQYWLLAADNGYGYCIQAKALQVQKKSGKAIFTLGSNAKLLAPSGGVDRLTDRVALLTNAGYLLVLAATDVIELQRGKGQKLIGIPKETEETLHTALLIPANAGVRIEVGKRHLSLKAADLATYQATRGRRGYLLPRGLRKVERMMAM
jgi:topoisomerase-4 subunit A